MKRFYLSNSMKRGVLKGVKSIIKVAKSSTFIVSVALALIVGSCTNSDILFGNDVIPEYQEMTTSVDSTMTVKVSQTSLPYIWTNQMGFMSLGSYNDDVWGYTKTERGIATYNPGDWFDDNQFGENPTLDSMIANFYFYAPIGDTTQSITVNLYTVKDTALSYYSSYRSNWDIEPYRGDFLGQFTITGSDSLVSIHLDESFYSQFLFDDYNADDGIYADDSLFIDKFKGMYFELDNPVQEAGNQGVMYWLNLEYSWLDLYFHNEDEEPDTTYAYYTFYDSYVYYGNRFYTIEHNYSEINTANGGFDESTIGDTTLNVDRIFIKGMGGMGARVELDTTFVNNLKAQAIAEGYRSVALQRASIKWHFETKDGSTYNRAALQMGLYRDITDSTFINDYAPIYDAYYSTTSDLGGSINRSNGYYEQVFTSTLQTLFNKPDDQPYTTNGDYNYVVTLFPSWYELPTYSETILTGANSDCVPEIAVTYTFIK